MLPLYKFHMRFYHVLTFYVRCSCSWWPLEWQRISYSHDASWCHDVLETEHFNCKQMDISLQSRSQWPRSQRHRSAAARVMGLRVRIPPSAWRSVFCECCVLSGRGLCVGLITRPEESYRVWCIWMWSWILDNEEYPGPLGAVAPC
jgi:hypothetical protein